MIDVLEGILSILGPAAGMLLLMWLWDLRNKEIAAAAKVSKPPAAKTPEAEGELPILAAIILAPIGLAWIAVIVILPFVILWWLL